MKARWNNRVIAESDATRMVEGNHYFPPEAVNRDYFEDSDTTSHCPWKGTANYCHLRVDGEINRDAVWYYPEPKTAAEEIAGYYAFWRGVEVAD